jgi:hypothetical protein
MTTAQKQMEAQIADQVDELGALERELRPYTPKLKRIDELRKTIRASFDTLPAAQGTEAVGKTYFAVIGPRAIERSIDPAKLVKAIGLKMYARLSTITLKMLTDNVDATIAAGVVSSSQTGARTLNVFERV